MLLRAQCEGVYVDTAGGDVGMVLVWLDEVVVVAIAIGRPVVAVELETCDVDGVVADGGDDTEGGGEATGGDIGVGVVAGRERGDLGLGGIGPVEPLLALDASDGGAVSDKVLALSNPNQLFRWVVKV